MGDVAWNFAGLMHAQTTGTYFGSPVNNSYGNFVDTSGYIGVQFLIPSSGFHFGWILYEHTGGATSRIVSWAYEETPGASILAGDEGAATVVELASFDARAASGGVRLTWETASEVHNEGFRLWRADRPEGEFVQVTESMISAQGSPVEGASYDWTDAGVEPGSTYLYKLEDVDIYGNSTFHGPVVVTMDAQCFVEALAR